MSKESLGNFLNGGEVMGIKNQITLVSFMLIVVVFSLGSVTLNSCNLYAIDFNKIWKF